MRPAVPAARGAAPAEETRQPPAVELRGVSKTYLQYHEKVDAVRDVSLAIPAGEFAAIIGRSGSGKSTLLHLLGLLDRPTSGDVLVEGKPTAHLSGAEVAAFRGRRVGFVFQTFNLIARFTVLENVVLPALIQGTRPDAARRRAQGLLERVGVGHRADHKGVHLSGGEQQRVAIARALVNDPALVLADEPTGSLDTRSSAQVMDLLAELHEEGRTLVFVTHDLGLARRAARVVELADGSVVRDTREARRPQARKPRAEATA